ncbi:hypothetical protein HX001_14400 [Empedobacter brevis]|uniref:Uncharacterized protein n=1 Tax=Empedobacter brevis TaxID=247 RepID=A0AAJ1QGT9_9FLAO|nr:hypothetical protein [Empedobacter brevis]MDM1073677.1 hypothetical protein [Empedobacter brevis]
MSNKRIPPSPPLPAQPRVINESKIPKRATSVQTPVYKLKILKNNYNMNPLSILSSQLFGFSDKIKSVKPEVSVRNYSSTVKIVYKNNDTEEHVFVSNFLQGEDLRTLFFKGKLEDNSFKELRISREMVSNIEVRTKEI